MMRWLVWAPLAAASCHVFEEFVWPGGFTEWYRAYRSPSSWITTRFLLIVNALLLLACLNYALMADTRWGAAVLLAICSLLCSNGVWHAWASVKSHTVSPGVVTGTLLYIPLMITEFNAFLSTRRVGAWTAATALAVGGSYHAWSALYYKGAAKP